MNKYKLRKVIRDGIGAWLLTCPACKQEATIDNDQRLGKVSIQCDCGNFHETINFTKK